MVEAGREAFLKTARERYDRSEQASSDWRKDAKECTHSLVGDQWDAENKAQRQRDGRPCLTVNRLSQLARLVSNEISRSKLGMAIHPVDSDADVDTAQVLLGIVRHIERITDSTSAYGTATDNQVRCGKGYFGLKTRYAKSDGFEQEICLRVFHNAEAIYDDPSSVELDGSDANFRFVVEKIPRDIYEELYPKSEANKKNFGSRLRSGDNWVGKDEIQVAEYWYVERTKKKLVKLQTGRHSMGRRSQENLQFKRNQGMIEEGMEREVEIRTVKRAVINGHEVLEEDVWPGAWIPIFPVYGEVLWVDGKARYLGLIKNAIEPQNVLNYLFSAMVELMALAPKAPYIAARQQIQHNKEAWTDSNIRSHAVLEYEPQVVTSDGATVAVPAPKRNTFEPPIQALVAGIHMAEESIRHAVGLHAPSIGQLSSERSGKAIESLQAKGSLATYHFVLNFARALRFCVRQLVGDGENQGLIQKIYHEDGRIMRIIGEDTVEQQIGLGKDKKRIPEAVSSAKDFAGVFDIGVGLYDVEADSGQAFGTQRQEAFAAMSQIFQSDPSLMKLFGDVWLRNADFPGAKEMADRAFKILPPHLRGEGEPEIPPEVQQQMQQSQQQMQQMDQEMGELKQTIQTKQIEMASEERIKSGDRQSKERIAAVLAELEAAKIMADALSKDDTRTTSQELQQLKASIDLIKTNVIPTLETEDSVAEEPQP